MEIISQVLPVSSGTLMVLIPLLLLSLGFFLIYALLLAFSKEPRPLTEKEKQFTSPRSKLLERFPSIINDPPRLYLSVIVPAYNETKRLPDMLKSTLDYLEKRRTQKTSKGQEFTYEIIVVDDGSRDQTAKLAQEVAVTHAGQCPPPSEIRVLKFEKNRGKGGAVTQGINCARGRFILFADADGATKFSDLDMLEKQMLKDYHADDQPYVVCIGSRSHLVDTEAVVKRSKLRNFLMRCFHLIVYLLSAPGVRAIKDTQCGFKLFSREAARQIFPSMHVEGWIFDIEILHLASAQNMKIHEMIVNWHEVDGSKINLLRDSIKMAIDLFVIRFNYLLGRWTIKKMKNE